MIRVTEMKGLPRVFNLNNSETLRLLARQSKTIENELVSEELFIAQKEKLVVLREVGEK